MLPMPLPPRDIDGRNPKNAKTDISMFSFGKDGILYKCDIEREWQKYRTVSTAMDQKNSSLMIDKLTTMRGHIDNASLSKKKGIVLKSPPRFGISSKSMKIEKRSWDKALNMATKSGPISLSKSIIPVDSNSQLVIDAIVSNSVQNRDLGTVDEQPLKNHFMQPSPISQPIAIDRGDQINNVAAIIQSKYEQNLRVVERLFEENKTMEARMKAMEAELRKSQSSSAILKEDSIGEVSAESLPAPPTYDELFGQESFERGRKRNVDNRNVTARSNPASSSPDLYARDVSPFTASYRSRSLSAIRSSARWKRRGNSLHTRSLSRSRSRSRSGARNSDDPGFQFHKERLRALSSSRVSGEGLSRSLQADTDRYIQRKKAAEDKEWEQKLQQEFYEAWLEQRFRKAAENGSAFTDMMERAKKAETSAKIRADRKAMRESKREAEQEAKKKNLIHTALEKAKESLEPYKDLTWEQIQTLQAAKRKERIEARQRQLLSESSLPPSLTQSMNRVDSSKSAARISKSLEFEKPYQFKATDPETVARKLASMQHGWKVKEANDKQRQLEQKEARKQTLAADERVVEAMKQRRDTSRSRKESRLRERKEQEDLQEAKRLQAEKLKAEKLMQTKLPPPLLTKSAEIQKEKMLREKELRQREEDKVRREKDRKERELKETAAALQVAISEREIERRNNGFVELRSSESLKEAAVQAREEYRRKLRENKQRIRESLSARPSLLDRHDKSLATKAAASQALQKVAVAVTGGDFSEEKFQSAIDDDDLFGDREKAILGMSKSSLEDTKK